MTNLMTARSLHSIFRALPHPARIAASILFVILVLLIKRIRGIENRVELTPTREMFSLSWWGIPKVVLEEYSLTVQGEVSRPAKLSFNDILALSTIERIVRLDCVGGPRSNCIMKGIPLRELFTMCGVRSEIETAVFCCADGYYTTLPVTELIARDAFMAYEVNGERIDHFGFPLRLAVAGKYGYKWAKWVKTIELVRGRPKGYWERLGLPNRADSGRAI